MDGPREYSIMEISQTKTKGCMILTCMWNVNNNTNECIWQNRNRIIDIENKQVVNSGETEGGRKIMLGYRIKR